MEYLCFWIMLWLGISTTVEIACGDFAVLFTPSYFYSKGLNWFGAYLCTILIGMISPAMFAFKILKWLCTVGK